MLKSHLLIALRVLRRRPGFSAINIFGLGIGIACCAVLALYVWGELSYDRFHENADQVYRVESTWGGGNFSLPATNWPFAEVLRTERPELEMATLLRTNTVIRREDRLFREDAILFANDAFFDVFSFRLERGDEATALTEPNTVVLTRELAAKYFGDEDPVGQGLRAFGTLEFTVTGILAPPPGPTHVPLNALISWATLEAIGWTNSQGWGNNSVNAYLRFPEGSSPEALAASFPALIERHAGEGWNGSVLSLRPVTDIHLYSDHSAELQPGGNPAYVTLFAVVALFILLLAAVNFVNLSTARSLERAKEVGVRKSIGAGEGQLARQFLAEAVLLAAAGLVVAVALVALAVPMLTGLVGRPMLPDVRTLLVASLVTVGLTLLVGIGGGLYPALALSRFRPVEVLRGRFSAGRGGVRLRQGLVVFQFAVAVVLLVGTFVVYGQLQHLRTADLGFDESQVLALRGPGAPAAERLAFFDAVRAESSVEEVASITEPMPAELLSGWGLSMPGAVLAEDEEHTVSTRAVTVSAGFFETLGVPFLAGRDFRAGAAPDSGGVILNESAARRLMAQVPDRYAMPQELVGEVVQASDPLPIIGVVEDFHMASLHQAIEPIAFYYGHAGTTYLVRAAPGGAEAAIGAVRRHWTERFPEAPLEYHFVDEAFGAAYRAEEQLAHLALLFASLAVLVACLGLFGLATYAAERRRKEIGVRKVLGASVASVVALLSQEFVRLVAVAVAVGTPVAYVGVGRWLEGFPSRVDLGPGPFVLAGAVAVAIAVASVAGQALRAATADPVHALRSE